jgi:hypothetical protein
MSYIAHALPGGAPLGVSEAPNQERDVTHPWRSRWGCLRGVFCSSPPPGTCSMLQRFRPAAPVPARRAASTKESRKRQEKSTHLSRPWKTIAKNSNKKGPTPGALFSGHTSDHTNNLARQRHAVEKNL